MFIKRHLHLLPLAFIAGLMALGACNLVEDDEGSDTTIYTLTVTADPAEGGSVTPASGEFEENEQVQVTANPASGWTFTGWSGSITSTDNPLSFNITEDTDLTAHFVEQSQYTALLDGEYIMTHISHDGPDTFVAYFLITLNGSGSGTWEELYSSEGSPESGSLTYAVNDDRTFTVNADGQLMFRGIVHADGQSYTMANTTGERGINVGIKKSSGMSNASLNGEYIMTHVSHDGPDIFVSDFLITLDGSGNGTFEELHSSEGTSESGSLTYSVNSDGTFTVNADGQLMFRGIVHADGQSYTMANTTDEIGVNLGMKKSLGMSNTSLNGEYIMTNITYEGTDIFVGYFLITLNGDGSGTWEELYTTDSSSESGSLTYTVSDDGTLTVDAGSPLAFNGIVHPDGQSYTMVNTQTELIINMGIKKE